MWWQKWWCTWAHAAYGFWHTTSNTLCLCATMWVCSMRYVDVFFWLMRQQQSFKRFNAKSWVFASLVRSLIFEPVWNWAFSKKKYFSWTKRIFFPKPNNQMHFFIGLNCIVAKQHPIKIQITNSRSFKTEQVVGKRIVIFQLTCSCTGEWWQTKKWI